MLRDIFRILTTSEPLADTYTHRFRYTPIFELLLRLRANYIWPAEWDSMLAVDDPMTPMVADTMGIVMGTSHTEPLMRWTKEQSLFLGGEWGAWKVSSMAQGVVVDGDADASLPDQQKEHH
jgi:hypothetical protein